MFWLIAAHLRVNIISYNTFDISKLNTVRRDFSCPSGPLLLVGELIFMVMTNRIFTDYNGLISLIIIGKPFNLFRQKEREREPTLFISKTVPLF